MALTPQGIIQLKLTISRRCPFWEAEQILTPYVEKYCEVINNGEFHKIGPDFYDENAVMVEKSKNCVWGQKGIHFVKWSTWN